MISLPCSITPAGVPWWEGGKGERKRRMSWGRGSGLLGGEGHLLLGVVLGGGGDHGRVRSLRFGIVFSGRKWGVWGRRGSEEGEEEDRLSVGLGGNRTRGVKGGVDRGGGYGDRVGRGTAVAERGEGDGRC